MDQRLRNAPDLQFMIQCGPRLLADGQALRVLLNNPPRDRHGRTLANLYVGDDDLGLTLVSRGHALRDVRADGGLRLVPAQAKGGGRG